MSAHPIQLYRAPPPAASPKPWVPAPAAVAPKAGLIPAGLRGPRVKRRPEAAVFPRPIEAHRQAFRSITRVHMHDASTLRTMDPSPRVFVRARLTHLLKEGTVFVFGVTGFLAFILAMLFVMGPA